MANLQIVISALNKASGDLNKVKKDIEGLGTAGKAADGGLKGIGDGLSAVWKAGLSAAAAVAAAAGAVKLLTDAAQEGAAFQRMEEASGSLAESMGADMADILSSLRGASLGMVSDFDLMQSASRAMMLGVSADAGELSQLMEVAAIRGRAMGLTTTQAFNDIVTGIGRASPFILDNLGIVVDAEARYKAYADSVGKTAEELSKAEKTQALLNGVLESSKGLLESTGGLTVDNAGKWEQLSAAQKNYFDMVKGDIADATSWWASFWTLVYSGMNKNYNNLEAWTSMVKTGLMPEDLLHKFEMYKSRVGEAAAATNLLSQMSEELKTHLMNVAEANAFSAEKTQEWADSNYEGAEASIKAQIAAANQAAAQRDQAAAASETASATLTATDAMKRYSEQMLFNMASEGLSEDAKYALAEAMGMLDYKTVYATQRLRELETQYKRGDLTAAQYRRAVADLNDEIANMTDKEAYVKVKIDETEVINWKPPTKRMRVDALLDSSNVDSWQPGNRTMNVFTNLVNTPELRASGGPVYRQQPYMWQEYGYKGELFVPSSDGFILSRADAERALSRALTGGGSALDPEAIGKAVAKALSGVTSGKSGGGNVYNLTMPTSSNPADVRTAFELMEAWNA